MIKIFYILLSQQICHISCIFCFNKIKYRNFLRRWDGEHWPNIYTPNADRIRGMDYLAPDNIWGVCEWGEIIHFRGLPS